MPPPNFRWPDAQGIDRARAVALAAQIKAFAHPIRLQVLGTVITAAPQLLSARQIQPHVAAATTTINHHLGRLQRAGLITRSWDVNRALHTATPAARDLWPLLRALAPPDPAGPWPLSTRREYQTPLKLGRPDEATHLGILTLAD